MKIKEKIHIFLSKEEQVACLRSPENLKPYSDNKSESVVVYNLSFIKEYKKYSSYSYKLTLGDLFKYFEISIFMSICLLIIILTSSYFIKWFGIACYLFSLTVLILNSIAGVFIGKIKWFQSKIDSIDSEAILLFEKKILTDNVKSSKICNDTLPSSPPKRL